MSIPPPGTPDYAHPAPLPELPEVPDGVTPSTGLPPWKPWTSFVALIAALGATIAASILIVVVAAIFGADFDDAPPGVVIGGTVAQDLCLILAAIFFARMAATVTPAQFGLRGTRFWPAVGWSLLAPVAYLTFSAAWIALLDLKDQDNLPDELGADESTAALIAVAVLVAVVAPLAEEFFFRGYFFTALRNWRGIWPAAVITGLVFGGIHAGSTGVGFLVPLAVFGFLQCLLYVRTGSLYPCIVLHCVNNSFAFGHTQGWGWESVALLAGSLALIALILFAVQRRFGRVPALASG